MKDELEIVQASSRENPYFPEAEYERKKATMDPRRFNMIYGGQFHKMEGLVYDVFSEDHHIVQAETLDPRTIFLAGVDWGFTNPSCILVLGVEPSGRVTVVNEYYQAQQTINHMVEVAGRLKKIYGIERFYCDPSSPANILEFNKASLTAIPANNDIRNGVDSTYELIKKDKFRIFSGRAPNLVDELSIYHYPAEPDYNADKDLKEQLPVKQNDHACDALRYVVHGISLTSGAKRDTVGGRQPDMRLHVTDDLLKQRLDDDYDW